MYILGINAFHGGASASLIKDGELIAAVEEERFERIKYWAGFPSQSIKYCLGEAGITPYDLDHIGVSRDPNANLMKKVLYTISNRPNIEMIQDRLSNTLKTRDLKTVLGEELGLDLGKIQAKFHNIEHHRAHMASAFFVSPFDQAAILSVDGMGDFVSTMWGVGSQNQFEVLDSINFPHSVGYLYTAVTQWLGFPRYGDEGKAMGLTSYGDPIFLDRFENIIQFQEDGRFHLNMDYFSLGAEGATMTWDEGAPIVGRLYSEKFVDLFGPPRQPEEEITEHHENVAASLQRIVEMVVLNLIIHLQKETGEKALCLAGGVALNSVVNGKILPETNFDDIFINPASGDNGTSLGVCYYIHHQILDKPRSFVLDHSYTGPKFGNSDIERALKNRGLTYQVLDNDELITRAAEIISDGDVLGWFQGRMEFGPRALGNRSIIADPTRDDMRDIINARIKHREKFRPFAPSILAERVGDYFDQKYPDPFMIKVYNVLPEKRSEIPAVTHVDGTGRLQTVHKETNPLYWKLINAFKNKTGVPVVLNTSFNEREPIVCTPEEAVDTFLRTKMDALAIGNFLVEK